MTKKDYIALGNMLRENQPRPTDDDTAFAVFDRIEIALCEVLAKDNPRFDAEKFHEFVYRREGE